MARTRTQAQNGGLSYNPGSLNLQHEPGVIGYERVSLSWI